MRRAKSTVRPNAAVSAPAPTKAGSASRRPATSSASPNRKPRRKSHGRKNARRGRSNAETIARGSGSGTGRAPGDGAAVAVTTAAGSPRGRDSTTSGGSSWAGGSGVWSAIGSTEDRAGPDPLGEEQRGSGDRNQPSRVRHPASPTVDRPTHMPPIPDCVDLDG